jgi:hypothetical protein
VLTPVHTELVELRRQDLLAASARTRLVAQSSKSVPAPRSRPLGRVVGYARYAVAALASVAFAMTTN